jgi:hypothetical protein
MPTRPRCCAGELRYLVLAESLGQRSTETGRLSLAVTARFGSAADAFNATPESGAGDATAVSSPCDWLARRVKSYGDAAEPELMEAAFGVNGRLVLSCWRDANIGSQGK